MTELAPILKEVGPTAPAHIEPEVHIEYASRIADALSSVVEKQKLYTRIGEKTHVNAEGWETVIALDMAHPIIDWTNPILGKDGEIVAYKARAIVVKNGETISSGEMICGLDDEFVTKGKNGWAKHRAAVSAAQTWAVAKAGRTKYAWIVTLAGYSGTPAEEMVGVHVGVDEGDKSQSAYWCAEHKTEFFKKGRMRGYAHPIEGSDGWHNMVEETETPTAWQAERPAEAPESPVDGPQALFPQDSTPVPPTPARVADSVLLTGPDFGKLRAGVGWTTDYVQELLKGLTPFEWIKHPDGKGVRSWTMCWNECVERSQAADDAVVV